MSSTQTVSPTTHLREAILLYENILSFNPETYKDFIKFVLDSYEVKTQENLNLLIDIINIELVTNNYIEVYVKGSQRSLKPIKDTEKVYRFKITETNNSNGGSLPDSTIASLSDNPIPIEIDITREIAQDYQKLSSFYKHSDIQLILIGLFLIKSLETISPSPYPKPGPSSILSPEKLEWDFIRSIKKIKSPDRRISLIEYGIELTKKNINKFLIDFNTQFCYHFIKSFLNAEYLILDDYTRQLKGIERLYRKKYGMEYMEGDEETERAATEKTGNDPDAKADSHSLEMIGGGSLTLYLVKSCIKISWKAIEACALINRCLNKPSSELFNVSGDNESRFNSLSFTPPEMVGEKTTVIYEKLIKSVIDITVIDHCFHLTPESVEKLFSAIERAEALIKKQEHKGDEKFVTSLMMVVTKAATMLNDMLNSEANYLKDAKNTYPIVRGQNKQELLDRISHYSKVDINNDFLMIKKACEDKILEAENILNNYDPELLYDNNKDIKSYNQKIISDIHVYCDLSPYFCRIQQLEKKKKVSPEKGTEVKDILISGKTTDEIEAGSEEQKRGYMEFNQLKELIENLEDILNNNLRRENQEENKPEEETTKTATFYATFIPFIHRQIDHIIEEVKENEFIDKETIELIQKGDNLLIELLEELRVFIRNIRNSSPPQFRPIFEHSFYEFRKRGENPQSSTVNQQILEKKDFTVYNYPEFENLFFFSSFKCSPIYIDLFNRILKKYENKRSKSFAQHLVLYNKYTLLKLNQQIAVFEENFKAQLGTLEEASKGIIKRMIDRATNSTQENINKIVEEVKKDNTEKLQKAIQQNERYIEAVLEEASAKNILALEATTKQQKQIIDSKIGQVKKDNTKTLEDSLNKKKTEIIKEIEERIQKDSTKNRHHTIQLLGIFAAFLAFVTVNIGLINIASNIPQYIVFTLTFTLALVIFARMLPHNGEIALSNQKQQKHQLGQYVSIHKGIFDFSRRGLFCILIFLCIPAALIFYHEELKYTKPDPTNGKVHVNVSGELPTDRQNYGVVGVELVDKTEEKPEDNLPGELEGPTNPQKKEITADTSEEGNKNKSQRNPQSEPQDTVNSPSNKNDLTAINTEKEEEGDKDGKNSESSEEELTENLIERNDSLTTENEII